MSSHAAAVTHRPDQLGHFGGWGGRFVPEVLMAALDQLTEAFEDAVKDPAFNAELDALRRDYAGRPTPLFPARPGRPRARTGPTRSGTSGTGAGGSSPRS